jgi:hypothetical protein
VPDGGGINVGVADGSSKLRTALVLILPLDPVPRVDTRFFSMPRLLTSGLGGGLALAAWATGDGGFGRGGRGRAVGQGMAATRLGGGGPKEGRDAGGCVVRAACGRRPGSGTQGAAAPARES